jgi:hypothetical protein
MRNFFSGLVFVFLAFGLFSCLSQNSTDLKAIEKTEAIFKDKHDSAKLASQLDNSYKTFIRKYPSDTNIPRMLFEDAQLNIFPLRRTQEALNQLEELYTKYPDNKYSPNALFKAAFLNENVMGRKDVAKTLYLQFIKTYPTNSLVSDAKLSVENIDLSPEAQLRKIQAAQDSLKKSDIVKK